MPNSARALLIGMLGPALQAIGLVWDVASHALSGAGAIETDLHHLLFDPSHLVIAVGFMVSLVCVPLAIEVALARPEELEIPNLDPEPEGQAVAMPAGTLEAAE